jgi:hypothetical protein
LQSYFRLRQICLAAPDLAAASALIRALLGLEECHRDPHVARYGLANALFPIGADRFLEIVSPLRSTTAAGRFMDKAQGRGGYMLIFDCDDPKARAERARGLGVRLVNHIDHERYQGYQLHPKDCRAALLEFNQTRGGEEAHGPYWPAGEHWQNHVRRDVTRGLEGVEVLSHDPAGLASLWSAIMAVPAAVRDDCQVITVGGEDITMRGAPVSRERLDALILRVRGAAGILAKARQFGLETREDAFALCGVWMKLREEGT